MDSKSKVFVVKSMLLESGLASESKIIGCSLEEVSLLERKFCITLPKTYVKFLLTMGKSCGDFLVGSDFLYDSLFELREAAEYLISSTGSSFELGKDDFVFLSHQGYVILFFDSRMEDPPILRFVEGDAAPDIVGVSFLCWLESAATDEINLKIDG